MSASPGQPVAFTALIPARLASTRLPDKPLADIGGLPMVVRVAQQAQRSGAARTVVAADHPRIADACRAHGIESVLTAAHHATGSDRLAEACALLGLDGDAIVVNVQGDEPLVPPGLVADVARCLAAAPGAAMATAAHAIHAVEDFLSPHVVKLVCDAAGHALYFSRAPIPWWRDANGSGLAGVTQLPAPAPLRHIGLYAYRAGFLRGYPALGPSPHEQIESLEQLRVLWHGHRIAVHTTADAPPAGVDTLADLARVRALFGP